MKTLTVLPVILLIIACSAQKSGNGGTTKNIVIKTKFTKAEFQDKIKGGWAGQVIGCTFGGPTEFNFKGTLINDYQPISWDENSCLRDYQYNPGLYDDVYMDLTFVDVLEKEGLDAPADSLAQAFANAGYSLWHANQAARYNIQNGIRPPQSGYWKNNPHSDDIDFQIEADFAGLMSPGMVNTASAICDKTGHIMNYGDGWYGGVYMAAMYSLAFVSDSVEYVVEAALNAVPRESEFYRCISDVIRWYYKYPDDWKQTWFETEKKWSADIGCPDGVFKDFDIDAKINAAHVVIGLLYGHGDYAKTLEIATRCGQDSDCNPASAGGILGTILGYSKIPQFWKKAVYPVEDMDFKYTTMSLNDVYRIGMKHALEEVERNNGKISGDSIMIAFQQIHPVALEMGFEGLYPVSRKNVSGVLNIKNPLLKIQFTGNGFVLTGGIEKTVNNGKNFSPELKMEIDGLNTETFRMPTEFRKRRQEIAWKYQLPEGKHTVTIQLLHPGPGYRINPGDLIVYSSKKPQSIWKTDMQD